LYIIDQFGGAVSKDFSVSEFDLYTLFIFLKQTPFGLLIALVGVMLPIIKMMKIPWELR
jgi:hypothetical protein